MFPGRLEENLRQDRIMRQERFASNFYVRTRHGNAGILGGFQVFATKLWRKNFRKAPPSLCGVALKPAARRQKKKPSYSRFYSKGISANCACGKPLYFKIQKRSLSKPSRYSDSNASRSSIFSRKWLPASVSATVNRRGIRSTI